ncbi:glycoside hydrolase family 36 protein [Flammeovirga sp. EKP202]|uniref:glycoside hydrolase family 36 protein n=1 Tax=Flammeovirga sp. EKP202 TaxID=2770592 RepID=UPI00165ECB75|nr:glycoside hydrolase family 36 protein [Flammeovirga sp. EKP202]MBD0400602.1 alpha-galactosidase [Flammeovirga sp. EKP202]
MKWTDFLLKLLLFTAVAGGIQSCSSVKEQQKSANVSSKAKTFWNVLSKAPAIVEDKDGNEIKKSDYTLTKKWDGNLCKATITNTSNKVINPKDIILFAIEKHGLNPESPIYGEGFQMLHQNSGTLANHENIGNNPDNKHYKMKDLKGLPTAYGLLNINVDGKENFMLGFPSCKKFIGRIAYDGEQMFVGYDAEGLSLKPGESWELEDFLFLDGPNQGDLFDVMADEINKNHKPRRTKNIPTGWCSWYCYRMEITDQITMDNLDIFSKKLPELEYIQLDDGYQPYMGDWLEPNPKFGDVRETINGITKKGFKPAIWVAPFIAQKESKVFKEHPDWFVKNQKGEPLVSSEVSFGGWREGPWYCMDGTHPEVQKHFEHIFRTMREEWGVNYFKLDANYWGAIQEGVFYDKNATRIEAYRRGMEAVLKGCDENTVVLGCNAPIWPSFGLVTAQRTSGDIRRAWWSFKSLAKQNLSRCWQNEKIWDADPDCLVLGKSSPWNMKYDKISEDEWLFHASSIHAVGGFVLSGDKAELLNEKELKIVKKLLNPTGKGARFENTKMEVGVTDLGDKQYYYFFNWTDEPIDLSVELKNKSELTDFWTDEELGVYDGTYKVNQLRPHASKILVGTASNSIESK